MKEGNTLIIKESSSLNTAWRKALTVLVEQGVETDNDFYYRDQPILFEIDKPMIEAADPLFPMSPEDVSVINEFMYSGNNEDQVCHPWTKLYHHRLFDQPNAQIPYMIDLLKKNETYNGCVGSIWDKDKDQYQYEAPCSLIIWCRIKYNKLVTHVHAYTSDAYAKLLMNLSEFVSLHLYIAKELGIEAGMYRHFFDACCVHFADKERAEAVVSKF